MVRTAPPPAAPAIKAPHDYLFVRAKFSGSRSSQGGVWSAAVEESIIVDVSQKHSVSVAELKGKGRSRTVVAARFEAYFRLSTELGYSLPMIGRAMGGKEHTGVMHGIRRYKERMGAAGL